MIDRDKMIDREKMVSKENATGGSENTDDRIQWKRAEEKERMNMTVAATDPADPTSSDVIPHPGRSAPTARR